jgi:uncharacterized phage infection (PIP) family protein YhgE
MRKEFPGYFRQTPEQAEVIWTAGLVVFDTNALLNLYRYTESTRVDLLSAIRTFGDRVRIPYQVADEFFKNRVIVISEQRRAYQDLLTSVESAKTTIGQAIAKHGRRHTQLNTQRLQGQLTQCLQPLIEDVKALQSAHPDLLTADDFVLEELAGLVEGRVIAPKSEGELAANRKRAKSRAEGSH